jgi:hypothetical protein
MNMMKYCPECYKELPPNSSTCPFCGYRPKPETTEVEDLEAPKVIKTPRTDSYIPPEQTILSLLLLLICFWSINIAAAAVPIFLGTGTIRNIIIAAVASQVITRLLIGFWALEEQSLKRNSTTSKKVTSLLLAMIPIGGLFSFLQAARTTIRKDKLSNLTTASVFSVLLMATLLYATRDDINYVLTGEEPPQEAAALVTEGEIQSTEEPTEIPPTPTLRSYSTGCRNPSSVTDEELGDTITVCGKVTNFGDNECEACPNGFFSYIKLDGVFSIVSYDYHFSFAFLDDCLQITDTVETLGEGAVFQYGDGEECTVNENDELVCEESDYFEEYNACR